MKKKILYIDDNPMDKALVRDALEREHSGFELIEAANRQEFEKLLSEQKFDLVLSDFNILGYEGLQVIDFIKANYPEIPVIIVTGTGSEEIAVEAMKRSASDYIIKSPRHIRRLPYSIKKALNASRLKKTHEIIHHITSAVLNTDNLKEFLEFVKQEINKLIDTSNFFVALYDEQSNTFQLPYYSDTIDHFEVFPSDKTMSHYVVKNQKSFLAKHDDIIRLEKEGIIERIGTDSLAWIGIPLQIEDKVIGIMVSQNYTDENAYTPSDLELLEKIAVPVSLAIRNKKRNEELERLNRLLSVQNEELTAKIEEIQQYTHELKKAKEKAEESDRLKSAFLANMSHEIRTPMNGILGFLQLLKEPNLDEKNKNDYIEIVNISAERLLNTINAIIEVSQIDAGAIQLNYSEFNLSELIREQYQRLSLKAKSKGLDFTLNLPDEELFVQSDRLKIESILTNLISNAIKYTDKGYVEISLQKDKNELVLSVKDSGLGIPENLKEPIFDRFYRVNDKQHVHSTEGSGLGLSIAKSYVEMLGGTISLESTLGKGSTFYVRFDKSVVVSKN